MKTTEFKTWATPISIGSFIVIAITGMCMFFDVHLGLIKIAHKWIGLLMVIACIFHVIGNLKVFISYFTKPIALGIIIVIVLLGLAISIVPTNSRQKPPFIDYSQTMQNISLTLAAQVIHSEPELLKTKLEMQGIRVGNINQSINEIASQNNLQSQIILSIVFEGYVKYDYPNHSKRVF